MRQHLVRPATQSDSRQAELNAVRPFSRLTDSSPLSMVLRMSLHMVKLCVGCDSVEDLEGWIESRLESRRRAGEPPEHFHTTRMVPIRKDELLSEGSLFWVIKGMVQCRQRLLDIRPFTDGDGIGRCHLVLEPTVVRTDWLPKRAFQGWRYLKAKEAPADLAGNRAALVAMPLKLRRDLMELGLL
jgi:hypothetical protein